MWVPMLIPTGMEGMVYLSIAMLPAGHYVVMVCNSIHMAKPLREDSPLHHGDVYPHHVVVADGLHTMIPLLMRGPSLDPQPIYVGFWRILEMRGCQLGPRVGTFWRPP
jgi:hypothetical protein